MRLSCNNRARSWDQPVPPRTVVSVLLFKRSTSNFARIPAFQYSHLLTHLLIDSPSNGFKSLSQCRLQFTLLLSKYVAFPAVKTRYSSIIDEKRPRAGSRNRVPSISQHTENSENCIVTGDSATESPVHLCHVFHERYWRNHPMVSCLRGKSLVSKLISANLSSYCVSNGHGE